MPDTRKGKIDVSLLIKVLNLTQSTSDGEALNAIRIANSKLKAAGLTWEQVLSSKLKDLPSPKTNRPYKWQECPEQFDYEFLTKLTKCQEFITSLKDSQTDFLISLVKYFNSHKMLTEKQWAVIHSMWTNFREHDRG